MANLDGHSVLIPFSFNALTSQNFVLVFGSHCLHIAGEQGLENIPVIETPYAPGELQDISYAQVGDTVYLAHSNHPLHKVVRRDAPENRTQFEEAAYAWSLEKVALNASLVAPELPSVTFSGSAGSYTLRYKVAAVDAAGRESLPSPAGQCANGRHPSDWVQGNSAAISWAAVEGAVEYNIYREEAGYFGSVSYTHLDVYKRQLQHEAARREQWQGQVSQWRQEVAQDPHMGGGNMAASVARAQLALDRFDQGKHIGRLLEESGYGNHPEVLRFFNRVADALMEDSLVRGEPGGGMPPLEERMYAGWSSRK